MTYSESAEGVRITRHRALRELRDHGVEGVDAIVSFYAEVGDLDEYVATEVLRWLGY